MRTAQTSSEDHTAAASHLEAPVQQRAVQLQRVVEAVKQRLQEAVCQQL